MTTDDLTARIRRLEDRAEIIELPARYCLACDDRDIDGLVDLFCSDGTFRHGDGTTLVTGADALRAFYRERLSTMGVTIHSVHSSVITSTGPDTASAVVQGHVELDLQGRTVIGGLRYLDDYARHDGRWRFAQRDLCYWYQVPADERVRSLSSQLRRWWPADPVATVLPDQVPTWRSFHDPTNEATT